MAETRAKSHHRRNGASGTDAAYQDRGPARGLPPRGAGAQKEEQVKSSPHSTVSSLRARFRVSMRITVVAGLSAVALMLVSASSASAAPQYWIGKTQTAPSTHCYAGYGYVDLVEVPPTDPVSVAFTGGSRFACTQPFAAGADMGA